MGKYTHLLRGDAITEDDIGRLENHIEHVWELFLENHLNSSLLPITIAHKARISSDMLSEQSGMPSSICSGWQVYTKLNPHRDLIDTSTLDSWPNGLRRSSRSSFTLRNPCPRQH